MQRVLTTVTLLGLLVATAAAFVITEHLKLIRSPVFDVHISTKRFSPVCRCAGDKATITLRLRHRDRVTLTIQDAGRHTVRTLAPAKPEPAKTTLSFTWDGRTDSGTVAPEGTYLPQIHLARDQRTILFPPVDAIVVDTTPPRVVSASVAHRVFLPGSGHTIAIHYVLHEHAHAALYLDGDQVIRGRRTQPHGVLKWNGRGPGGKSLRPGRHVLSVGAVDLAGNTTPPAEQKDVVVRLVYLELAPHVVHVRAGARFTVSVATGAQQYTWRFAGRHGTVDKPALRLRAPAKAGRYRLLVTEDGHTAVALVKVRKK